LELSISFLLIMSNEQQTRLFYELKAGARLPGDWFSGTIPANIEVGENTVLDSSFCFKHFFSGLAIGFRAGNNVTLWRTSLAAEENALIEIGDYTYIANASLVCSERITIGSHVLIAGGVTIADSDFHPIAPAARIADTIALSPVGNRQNRPAVMTKPVIIEDDVWIGYNATILKGVRVGAGATIAPGALVIADVPAGAEVAGNPARVVKEA
jgi:acetyltransferase-like isoleucine patch superfamily enzyme